MTSLRDMNIDAVCEWIDSRDKMTSTVDISNVVIDRKEDWDKLAHKVTELIIEEDVKEVVLHRSVYAMITDKCRGRLIENVRNSVSNDVILMGKKFKTFDFLQFDKFLVKIVFMSSCSSDKYYTTVSVLKQIHLKAEAPPEVYRAIIDAYRAICKTNKMSYHKLKKRKSSPCMEESASSKRQQCSDCFDKVSDFSTFSQKNGTNISANQSKGTPTHYEGIRTSSPITHSASLDHDSKKSTADHSPADTLPTTFTSRFTDNSKTKKCYICKRAYNLPNDPSKMSTSWTQYPRLCWTCADYNYKKRHQCSDLSGCYAVVTGGRLKIGYEIVLRLLRDGAFVITTTRFPHDAAKRFASEEDFHVWCSRLKIHPLELKDMSGIHQFIDYVRQTMPHLDILINNAAQTLRRPAQFFRHLFDQEYIPQSHLPSTQQHILATDTKLDYGLPRYNPTDLQKGIDHVEQSIQSTRSPVNVTPVNLSESPGEITLQVHGINHNYNIADENSMKTSTVHFNDVICQPVSSVENIDDRTYNEKENVTTDESTFTKLPPTLEIVDPAGEPLPHSVKTTVPRMQCFDPNMDKYFPAGRTDTDGQQLDLRPTNSWRAVIDQVPVGELMEVLMVNSVAPFILSQQLKHLMTSCPHSRRYIVNVSAMEGQFNRTAKTEFHPHTNMAKAALNMMTRTAALGLREERIYMTSVDTGWVTDERPYKMARHQSDKGFVLPLDCVDGAARVCDPIACGVNNPASEPYSAVFLKNYKPYPW